MRILSLAAYLAFAAAIGLAGAAPATAAPLPTGGWAPPWRPTRASSTSCSTAIATTAGASTTITPGGTTTSEPPVGPTVPRPLRGRGVRCLPKAMPGSPGAPRSRQAKATSSAQAKRTFRSFR